MAIRYNPIISEGLDAKKFNVEDINTLYYDTSSKLHLVDEEALANEIYNILTTVPANGRGFTGERHFEPEFGAPLLDKVFEPSDAITMWTAMTDIVFAVQRWIPTLSVSTRLSKVIPSPEGDGFEINLVYFDTRLNKTISSRFIVAL